MEWLITILCIYLLTNKTYIVTNILDFVRYSSGEGICSTSCQEKQTDLLFKLSILIL